MCVCTLVYSFTLFLFFPQNCARSLSLSSFASYDLFFLSSSILLFLPYTPLLLSLPLHPLPTPSGALDPFRNYKKIIYNSPHFPSHALTPSLLPSHTPLLFPCLSLTLVSHSLPSLLPPLSYSPLSFSPLSFSPFILSLSLSPLALCL